jgi:hypothetical protein
MDELGEEGLNNLRSYGYELNALEASTRMYRDQIEQNALDMTNLGDAAKTAASIYLSDDLKETKEKDFLDQWNLMSKDEKKAAALDMAKTKYSNAEDVKIKKGKIMYKVDGEWKEGESWKSDSFASQYAASQLTKFIQDEAYKVGDKIAIAKSKGGAGWKSAVDKAMSASGGAALSRTDIAKLNEVLKDTSITLDENLRAALESSVKAAQTAFEKTEQFINESGINIDENLTSSAAQGFASHLQDILVTAGTESAMAVNKSIKALTDDSKLTEEQITSLYTALNGMDWTNMKDWEGLPNVLETLGINIPNDQLDNFINQCIEASGAIREINLDTLLDDLKSLGSVIKELGKEDASRKISDKAY